MSRRALPVPLSPARLAALPWKRIALVTAAVVLVVGLVPPLRRAAARVTSKMILFVASPLAPSLGTFDRLPESSRVLAADGSLLGELNPNQRREQVELARLPDHVKKAVLAAEDEEFYEHSGVDPAAVFRAFLRTAQGRTQGGSTITQQLAKLNYTSRERTLFRKLKEVLYATKLEKRYSKDRLLERYVNQVYLGDGAYGFGAGARVFFATTPEQLTPAQAATLAGKIRAPEGYDPRKKPEQVVERRNQVLANMKEEGWIDTATYGQAVAEPLVLGPEQAAEVGARAPHFVEFVKREAQSISSFGTTPDARRNQLFTGGFVIESTLEPKVFDAATAAVRKHLGQPADPATAVVSVQPGDGAIRNLLGGLDFARQQFDTASQARRQPGSAYKPYVYLAMLRDGIDPRSVFDGSSPRDFEYRGERFRVENYEGKAVGPTTVDDGLVHSINTVFVDLAIRVGPPDVADAAHDLRVPPPDVELPDRAAIALGGLKEGVTAVEMAAAFASFAAKGVYAEPYSIARIKDRGGNVVYEHRTRTTPAFKPNEVGVLNNTLQRVVREGTGRGAAIGRPVAGKTGTTQENRDAWFVGYVPQLTTAVWNGFLDNSPMQNVHGRQVTGGSFPASIFADTMRVALEGTPALPLHTASPDELELQVLNTTPTTAPTTTNPAPSTTTTSTTTTSTTFTTPVVPPPTTAPQPPPPGRTTTTTTSTTTTTRTTTTTTTTSTSTTTTTMPRRP